MMVRMMGGPRPDTSKRGRGHASKGPTSRNDMMVDLLIEEGLVRSGPVEAAMRAVDRIDFVPERLKHDAYRDHPLQIGYGQTISAPHMVAIMAEELQAVKGHRVLEIGSGSGYHAAVVGKLIGGKGHVFSVEVVPELADLAKTNLLRSGARNITVIEGDGSVGLADHAPFDRIYYTCSAPSVHQTVIDQLDSDGLILGVIGPRYSTQRLVRFRKKAGSIVEEPLTYCIFVPMVGKYGY